MKFLCYTINRGVLYSFLLISVEEREYVTTQRLCCLNTYLARGGFFMERQKARISRRELLKSLGIAGVGLSAFPFVTAFSDVHHQVAGLKETKASPLIPGNYAGTYSITCLKSGLVLDVRGGSLQNGAQIDQYYYNGGANQLWSLFQQGNGAYVIQSVNSGLVLDVKGGSLKNGALVDQYSYHGGTNQQWNLNYSNGYIIQSVKSRLVLDVKGGSLQAGALVDQYADHGGTNQRWSLT